MMDEVLERCGRKKGGHPETLGERCCGTSWKIVCEVFASETGLYVVIIPIALNELDTEILAAHHIVSHYSSAHIRSRK